MRIEIGGITMVFIVLKLAGVVGWSWLWVLAPTWIPLAFLLSFWALVGIGFLIAGARR